MVYENVVERERRGEAVAIMDNVTKIEPEWLASLAKNSPLLKFGDVVSAPSREFDKSKVRLGKERSEVLTTLPLVMNTTPELPL